MATRRDVYGQWRYGALKSMGEQGAGEMGRQRQRRKESIPRPGKRRTSGRTQ